MLTQSTMLARYFLLKKRSNDCSPGFNCGLAGWAGCACLTSAPVCTTARVSPKPPTPVDGQPADLASRSPAMPDTKDILLWQWIALTQPLHKVILCETCDHIQPSWCHQPSLNSGRYSKHLQQRKLCGCQGHSRLGSCC